ncbi:DUF4190 domain-containing protein [Luethyella okanaganae]|uniref:DUF4190 domain-containing protein n=1 Tax=Luethyella okanaganae TaxID=69372 RepID=A0ABW1VG88_9MICO
MTDQNPPPVPQGPVTPAPAFGQPAKMNVFAIVSLVTSIVGFSIVGIVFGHISLAQIKKTGEQGRGLAIAGLIVGYVMLVLTIVFIVFLILAGLAASTGTVTYKY